MRFGSIPTRICKKKATKNKKNGVVNLNILTQSVTGTRSSKDHDLGLGLYCSSHITILKNIFYQNYVRNIIIHRQRCLSDLKENVLCWRVVLKLVACCAQCIVPLKGKRGVFITWMKAFLFSWVKNSWIL